MPPETKICQNCKNDFIIEPDDFLFYEKIKVPPPTFCPECRMVRRMIWRNCRSLFKRECGSCGKSIISMYHKDKIDNSYLYGMLE
jgi:DNA-directed RNA polymerase subunit RPC12/RpoP